MVFDAPIVGGPRGYAYVVVPDALVEALGRGRTRVHATIDGCSYSGALMPAGGGRYALLVVKRVRAAIGKGPGDRVTVVLEVDPEPGQAPVPDDFAVALPAAVRTFFDGLTPGHRRAWVRWIDAAKRPETRARRIAQAVARLAAGHGER